MLSKIQSLNLFKGFAPISAEKVKDDITRYRVGYFKTLQNANDAKNQVRSLGYKDAFVVALNNGIRIKLSDKNFTGEFLLIMISLLIIPIMN